MSDKTDINDGDKAKITEALETIENEENRELISKHIETLDIQRVKNRDKGIDPETGKTWKELYDAQTLEKETKPNEVETAAATPKEKPEESKADTKDLETRVETKVDLRMAGYSQAEITEIETYAKGQGKALAEVIETNEEGKLVPDSPFLQAAIDGLRAKAKVERATPPSSQKTQTFKAGKAWSEMTPKERKGAFESGEVHDQVKGGGAQSVE